MSFTGSARWAGPSVTATGEGTVLRFNGNNLTAAAATLTVEEGVKVKIAEGVGIRVHALVLNGQKMPVGVYSKANKPAFFDGAGHVVVGTATVIILR